jgi:hypothetical protein
MGKGYQKRAGHVSIKAKGSRLKVERQESRNFSRFPPLTRHTGGMEKLGLRVISIVVTIMLMSSLGILVTRSKEPRTPLQPNPLKQVETEAAKPVVK